MALRPTDESPAEGRSSYEKPRLIVLGTLAELTLGDDAGNDDVVQGGFNGGAGSL